MFTKTILHLKNIYLLKACIFNIVSGFEAYDRFITQTKQENPVFWIPWPKFGLKWS